MGDCCASSRSCDLNRRDDRPEWATRRALAVTLNAASHFEIHTVAASHATDVQNVHVVAERITRRCNKYLKFDQQNTVVEIAEVGSLFESAWVGSISRGVQRSTGK